MSNVIPFEDLKTANLIIDAVYEGGSAGNAGDDPISKLLFTENSGGFRIRNNINTEIAYLVLYTSGEDINWPDTIDKEKGIVKYFGDNKNSGKDMYDTYKKGNKYLENVWGIRNDSGINRKIPVFLFIKKPTKNSSRSVQFIGLLVPHIIGQKSENLLRSIWRTDKKGNRFQNYEAFFSILNLGKDIISKEWINNLIKNPDTSDNCSPLAWKKYKRQNYITDNLVLKSPRLIDIRDKELQLPKNIKDQKMLQRIIDYFDNDPYAFEEFAINIIQSMDNNFILKGTPKTVDGGRDGIGFYNIGIDNTEISLPCILEAKCYATSNSVGVRDTSRLISRLKTTDFGVLVTTSYIGNQAYKEIISDKHKVLIISGGDIIKILKNTYITDLELLENYLSDF